jgi:hypothetical protein
MYEGFFANTPLTARHVSSDIIDRADVGSNDFRAQFEVIATWNRRVYFSSIADYLKIYGARRPCRKCVVSFPSSGNETIRFKRIGRSDGAEGIIFRIGIVIS